MKYMLLIYSNEKSREWVEREGDAIFKQVDEIMAELKKSGELVGGMALADPINSKSIRPQGGTPVVTDGPFLEAKEYLAGYLTVDVESAERATEIAARWPDARFCGMEVRPVIHDSGAEM